MVEANLSSEVLITSALDYVDDSADRNGTVLDMANYEGVIVTIHFAAIASSAVLDVRMQEGTLANGSDMTDLKDTKQVVADDDDNKIFKFDIAKTLKQFLRVVVNNDASNNSAQSAMYEQYGGKKMPETNTNITVKISPVAGTA